MNVLLSPIYARRRRPAFLIFAAIVVFCFLYTSNRLLFSSSGILSPSMPVADSNSGESNQDSSKDGGNKGGEKEEVDDLSMSYGTASRPNFYGLGELRKLGELSAQHVPAVATNKRLVIVGDVHGMIDPLQELLGKLAYDADSGDDHLVFVGDMVSDGPDSAAVVELARTLGASGVRGVREDRILLARGNLNSTATAAQQDNLEQQHLSHGDYDERIIAESLSEAQVDYLAGLPVILKLGHVPTLGNAFVAHAGLVPGLELAKQDPWPAMHMRSVVYPRVAARRKKAEKTIGDMVKKKNEEAEKDGSTDVRRITDAEKKALIEKEFERTSRRGDRELVLPVGDYSGEDWAGAWDEAEARASGADRRTVFYGHDTKKGLSVGRSAIGLNTKCVYGGQLTAFVIQGTPTGIKQEVVQVDCKKEAEEEPEPVDEE